MKRGIRAFVLSIFIAGTQGALATEIVIRDYLLLPPVGRYGRVPFFQDPIEHARVIGNWTRPHAGDLVRTVDGHEVTWRAVQADEDGSISDRALGGGYAFAVVSVEAEMTMLLEATGHGVVLVNGVPRVGDLYGTGYVRIPVPLQKGGNEFLFHCSRGSLRAKLTALPKDVFIDLGDLTLTDDGTLNGPMAGIVVVNARPQAIRPIVSATGRVDSRSDRFRIPAHSLRKIPVRQLLPTDGTKKPVIVVQSSASHIFDSVELPHEPSDRKGPYKVGFVSAIDDSVQYYAVNPALRSTEVDTPVGIALSLHGAGVEAIGQAQSYSSKAGLDIICPTNRRPFGFDWEDWGRLDALEVLADSIARRHPDRSRIYLTGHSMGGHGTWILGALFPDRFAALGPSAGWISFSTYAKSTASPSESPVGELLARAASPSDTSVVFPNLAHHGIYILHGGDDDNVPAEQARTMVEHLSKFHHDFVYHQQPSVGHWWDISDEPGADCVDWAPLFDFFARRRLPQRDELRELTFVTPSPGVSSRCHWVTIDCQQRMLAPSSIHLRMDPHRRAYTGTTSNVKRCSINLLPLSNSDAIELELDGQSLSEVPRPTNGILFLDHQGDGWRVVDAPSSSLKGPHRYGPFKDAFRNRMVFVYGTQGTDEENAWAMAKARYDAETWWYRANGSVEVIPDVEFDVHSDVDRNVILYGNADTIACWNVLLSESPVTIAQGQLRVGEHREQGDDLACLFLRPRKGSNVAVIGVIGGSGLVGMRLTDRLPVFLSGVAYPDVTVLDPSVLESGANAVRGVGYFGDDWSVEKGEFQWRAGVPK